MSYVPIIAATAGSAAAINAAAAAKRMQDEEENMTGYNKDDLDGWEFKIMRSNTSKFKDSTYINQLCAEEAKAGWELVEKFDDNRIRFKRKTSMRGNDQFLQTDPYRTTVGVGAGQLTALILGIVFSVIGVLVFFIFMMNR